METQNGDFIVLLQNDRHRPRHITLTLYAISGPMTQLIVVRIDRGPSALVEESHATMSASRASNRAQAQPVCRAADRQWVLGVARGTPTAPGWDVALETIGANVLELGAHEANRELEAHKMLEDEAFGEALKDEAVEKVLGDEALVDQALIDEALGALKAHEAHKALEAHETHEALKAMGVRLRALAPKPTGD